MCFFIQTYRNMNNQWSENHVLLKSKISDDILDFQSKGVTKSNMLLYILNAVWNDAFRSGEHKEVWLLTFNQTLMILM